MKQLSRVHHFTEALQANCHTDAPTDVRISAAIYIRMVLQKNIEINHISAAIFHKDSFANNFFASR